MDQLTFFEKSHHKKSLGHPSPLHHILVIVRHETTDLIL